MISIIDMSHTIKDNNMVYPGSAPATVKKIADIHTNGYNETELRISTHTGTHIDCPYHFNKDGFKTSDAPIEQFIGKGIVLDYRSKNTVQEISELFFRQFEEKIRDADFIIINSGWSNFWETDRYLKDFPVLSIEAANYLSAFSLKGIGIDAISFDRIDCEIQKIHSILLGKNILLIENLTNIENLPYEGFVFCCCPLKIENGDGSPVRAYAMIN